VLFTSHTSWTNIRCLFNGEFKIRLPQKDYESGGRKGHPTGPLKLRVKRDLVTGFNEFNHILQKPPLKTFYED